MNKNLFKNVLVFLTLIVLFYGCGRPGYEPMYNPYTGSQGLDIKFVQGAPPDNVYEMEIFPVGILLENRGAYTIQRGIINLNYERDYMDIQLSDDTSVFLEGRTRYSPKGEEKVKFFYLESRKMDSMSQIRNSFISVTACYEYLTQLKTEACIDPDRFNLMNDFSKPCVVKELSFSGQGAPVGITRVIPSISITLHNEEILIPEFEIIVQNLDRGNVIRKERIMTYCSNQRIERDDFGIIEIRARLADRLLECTPSLIKLDERGTGKTRCRLNEGIYGASSAYVSLLDIDLRYGYTTTNSKNFKIHRR